MVEDFGTILSYSVTNTDIEGYWGPKSFYAAKIRYGNYGDKLDESTLMPKGGELTVHKCQEQGIYVSFAGRFK